MLVVSGQRAERDRVGAVLGVAAGAVALGAHVGAGGVMPSWGVLVVSAAVCALVGVLSAGVRVSLVRVVALVAGAQGLLHGLFLFTAPVPSASVGGVSEVGHHAVPVVGQVAGAVDGGHDHVGMWWAHTLAAVITVGLIYHGERLLRCLLTLGITMARRFVHAVAAVPVVGAPPRPHRRHVVAPVGVGLWRQVVLAVRPLRAAGMGSGPTGLLGLLLRVATRGLGMPPSGR